MVPATGERNEEPGSSGSVPSVKDVNISYQGTETTVVLSDPSSGVRPRLTVPL